MSNYTVTVAYHRDNLANKAMAVLKQMPGHIAGDFAVRDVNGSGFKSCSQLWNTCIAECETEIGIVCNEKARPTVNQVNRLIARLHDGYGLVGLFRFGFFGFRKELFRHIGLFDERYVGGWHEDNDMVLRIGEADIAYYETEEVAYVRRPSAWSHKQATSHWQRKWHDVGGFFVRQLPEKPHTYDLGPAVKCTWRPWSDSVLLDMSGGHLDRKMVKSAARGA